MGTTFSLNAQFEADLARGDEYEPAGRALAAELEVATRANGWACDAHDNWRDTGWALQCSRGRASLEVAFAALSNREWLLQVAPANAPGPLARLFGATVSADRAVCFDLAVDVHGFLVDFGAQNLRWLWDGFPDDGRPTRAPEPFDPSVEGSRR